MELPIKSDDTGWQSSTLTTTIEEVDMSAWVGRYVRIWADASFQFLFQEPNLAGSAPLRNTFTAAGDHAVGTVDIPFTVPDSLAPVGIDVFVGASHPWLLIAAATGTVNALAKPVSDPVRQI